MKNSLISNCGESLQCRCCINGEITQTFLPYSLQSRTACATLRLSLIDMNADRRQQAYINVTLYSQ